MIWESGLVKEKKKGRRNAKTTFFLVSVYNEQHPLQIKVTVKMSKN